MLRSIPVLMSIALAAPAPLPAQDDPVSIQVHVDPRVELMCVLFRLAGNPEYNQARISSYAEAVDAHFSEFAHHAAVRRARQMRIATGVSYDACMSMAIHLPGIEGLQGAVSFSPRPLALDSRWRPEYTDPFLSEVEDFVEETRFEGFLAQHRDLYQLTEARLEEVLEANIEMGWFEDFFGTRPQVAFTVIPGLLNGGGSYGPRVLHPDGREELFSILGVWQTDAEGQPSFGTGIVDTVVHEFGHSFCNPIIEAHLDHLREAAEKLWPYVADVMRSQAYGNWQTMMKESLVRASTTRYVAATRGADDHATAVAYEEGRGFEWTGEFSELLSRYEAQRDQFPTLGDFAPKIAEFFDGYADRFVELEEKRPKIIEMMPANGARYVDPGLKALVVSFDRPMQDGSWSVVGSGPDFPELPGSVSYDEARRVLTIPVKLKPDWNYELWLNTAQYHSFRSAEGVTLRPVRVTFRTRR